jgi:hypothetical protein
MCGSKATETVGTWIAQRVGMTVLSIHVFCVTVVLLLALVARDAR